MVKHITLSNLDIYNIAHELTLLQQDETYQINKYPIKINFYLQKNIKMFLNLAQEIENMRIDIMKKFTNDTLDIQNITDETVMQEEMMALFNLTQELTIYTIDLDAFGDMCLTAAEMSALSCMITETYEEEEGK